MRSNIDARNAITGRILVPRCETFIISTSYGNDSIALCQHTHELGLANYAKVYAVFSDTGWSAPGWLDRVTKAEEWVRTLGFTPVRLESMGMEKLITMKKGWPGNGQQFCSAWLKGYPYLEWLENIDPNGTAISLIGKRRAESKARANTPEFKFSEYHGGRLIWHPLYLHTDKDRNELLHRGGWEPLPHRSLECNPCVNANRADFLRLTPEEIKRVNKLEVKVGKPMFRPKRFNAVGIQGVVHWAMYGKDEFPEEAFTCAAEFGCGT